MSGSSSAKTLWHLVTEQSLQASDDVLESQLDKSRELLLAGLARFKPPPSDSSAKPTSRGKLSQFLAKLSKLIGVESTVAKQILSSYLAGDFRGTKASLKKLVDEDRFQKPLLLDVWQFYRAERLYLLRVLKELLTHACNPAHRHQQQFAQTLDDLRKDERLWKSLVSQLRSVIHEEVPSVETHGPYFTEQCAKTWVHFNLREQSELLQLILLYLHYSAGSTDSMAEKFKELIELFQDHSFGHRQLSEHLLPEVSAELAQSVGMLESLILVYLMDLPSLTGDAGRREVLPASMENLVSGLGSHPDHGPVMLAWMLSHYLSAEVDGRDIGALKTRYLGERAVQLRAVAFLDRCVGNEVIASSAALRSVAVGVCYALVSVLVSVFDPYRMGVAADTRSLALDLLHQEPIAKDFWRQGLDLGLGTVFATALSAFPAEMQPFCQLAVVLASASNDSAKHVVSCVDSMSVFAERGENISSGQIINKGGDKWQLTCARRPLGHLSDFLMPAGTRGISGGGGEGRLFHWQHSYNGWPLLLSEIELLTTQVSLGAKNVNPETLENTVAIVKLFAELFRQDTAETLKLPASKTVLTVVEKAVLLPSPPAALLASCLDLLCVVARETPRVVWERLADSGLFPRVVSLALGSRVPSLGNSNVLDVSPGLVGALLAQCECVNGEYPLTSAYLDITLACCLSKASGEEDDKSVTASLVYIARDIFPSFQLWRFAHLAHKEIFGQKMLRLFKLILSNKTDMSVKRRLCSVLAQPAPIQTLLRIVGTGDRVIQSLLESQSSWENGVGVELAKLTDLAMVVLERLLTHNSEGLWTDPVLLEDIRRALCSPPSGGSSHQQQQPHLLLTVAHYVYHVQSLSLPVSAMKLLAAIAATFPMSLLACLGVGDAAEAVRDILVFRLESRTEDIVLKIAIIDFFRACVDTQPGFIQLLIGAEDGVEVVRKTELTSADKARNDAINLVSDQTSLKAVLDLLKESSNSKSSKLHLSLVNFVLSLWQHQRIVATSYLKRDNQFWRHLTLPLFNEDDESGGRSDRLSIKSSVLRIMASEIYSYGGKVDEGLSAVLERLCDDKAKLLGKWNQLVLENLSEDSMDITVVNEDMQKEEKERVSLLGAWKTFVVVLSRDQPVTISPSQCHLVSVQLVKAIRSSLASLTSPDAAYNSKNLRVLTSLAELCLALMRRWQTKCAGDSMGAWCTEQGALLEDLANAFAALTHPRAIAAVLGIASTALKTSQFKLEKEEITLTAWMDPAATIMQKAFRQLEDEDDAKKERMEGGKLSDEEREKEKAKEAAAQQVPVLAVNLLRNLLQRLSNKTDDDHSNIWFPVFHRRVLLQTLLSRLHHDLRARQRPELAQSVLGILTLLARTPMGSEAMLASDLSQMLWLPLADVRQLSEWLPVFKLSLQLATTLLRLSGAAAVTTCMDVAALLTEQMTAFLLAPRANILKAEHVEMSVVTANFVAVFMQHHKKWHILHPTSLSHFYHAVNGLLHVSVCLLLRPVFLSQLVARSSRAFSSFSTSPQGQMFDRVRRMSSTDQELEAPASPETARVQNLLLDCACAALAMLRALSPDVVEVMAGQLASDNGHARYEQLLAIGFSAPTFEQEDGLTYGTLISLSNLCVRSITRGGGGGDRSPSPGRSASASPSSSTTSTAPLSSPQRPPQHQMDKRRLLLLLEQSLTLLLAQSLLSLSDPSLPPRDKQFLRRELGSEFSSFAESMRRYAQRGTFATRLPKTDEQFIKFISNVVQNVFK